MKVNTYRMASWWLVWGDLIYPENGIEEKVLKRAKEFKASGIDTVIIYGSHFRWDYIYNWERLHNLLTFIVDTCHKEGIRVFDHHSANLTHRVNKLSDYEKISNTNRHHVPFFPSREFADTITFNGHKLNDFRMLSVQDGTPCYLEAYNAETFCINNTDFINSYQKYLKKLLKTGIDGLMCDDVVYYPHWHGCGCKFCREKFKSKYGHDLPPATDENFWGNYASPAFKDWIDMRYHSSADFLCHVKQTVGADFPLISCCSNSSAKILDGTASNAQIMSKPLNNVMLEICGEIVSERFDYSERVPNFMLHKAIATKRDLPNIGLGYAHNPDSAFVVWAFNKIFGSSCWISTLTGRFGVSEEVRQTIPEEAGIIKEAYNFEQQHQDLFAGESSAKLAVLFSLDNLIYNGCTQNDYSQPWLDVTKELFKKNIQFDVVLDIPQPDEYSALILSNFSCMSAENNIKLLEYIKNGGSVIAAGLLGTRDERGVLLEKSFLDDFGVEFKNEKFNDKLLTDQLFDLIKCLNAPDLSSYETYHNGKKIDNDQWLNFGSLHWLPQSNIQSVIEMTEKTIPRDDIEVKCPNGWIYRILKDGSGKAFVHFLAIDIKPIPYANLKNNAINLQVVEKLEFNPSQGEISITSQATDVVLHSPDITAPVKLKTENNRISFDTGKIKRYMIVELN